MNLAVLALLDAQPVVSLTGLQLILALVTLVLGSGGVAALIGPYLAARTAKAQVKGTLTAAEIDADDKTQARLWEEVEKLRTRCDVKDKKVEELVQSNADLRSQHSELQGQLDQLQVKYASLEERNRVLDEEAASREERIAFLEAENASLRADLDQLRASQGVHNSNTDRQFSDMHHATDPEAA